MFMYNKYMYLFVKKNIFLRQIPVCDSSFIQISKSFDYLVSQGHQILLTEIFHVKG